MTRRGLWLVVLAAVVVAGAYLGAARRTTGPPLDPSSTSPDGARAVVELVGRLGGSMEVIDGAPDAGVDVALVLEDRLPRDQAEALDAWVGAGGTLVVADPGSLLTPASGPAVIDRLRATCDVGALREVTELDVGVSRTYAVPPGGTGCFSAGGGSFLVTQPVGSGTVVSVGGPDVFTNELLGEADNAVLAAALLAEDGRRAAFVRPGLPGGGDRGLADLIDTPVRAGLAQLLVAFLVVVAWRARRLGRPIEEPQPVRIEGSELTRAVGRLLERNRRPDRAAAVLRDRARRDLSGALGLPLDAAADVVAATLVRRTSLSEEAVHRAVAAPVTTDADLIVVAHLLARIREEITHDRATIPVD